MLFRSLDVAIPAVLSITITYWSSYNTGNGRLALVAIPGRRPVSTKSPGLSGYECSVIDLLFTLTVPLCKIFFIMVLGESGYCSIRNSNSVCDLFMVVFKQLHVN